MITISGDEKMVSVPAASEISSGPGCMCRGNLAPGFVSERSRMMCASPFGNVYPSPPPDDLPRNALERVGRSRALSSHAVCVAIARAHVEDDGDDHLDRPRPVDAQP